MYTSIYSFTITEKKLKKIYYLHRALVHWYMFFIGTVIFSLKIAFLLKS
jgi:hypothetical protein